MPRRLVPSFAVLLISFIAVCGFAQSLPDIASVKDLPATTTPKPKYLRLAPIPLDGQPDFHSATSSAPAGSAPTLSAPAGAAPAGAAQAGSAQAIDLSLPNVITVPHFNGSFISRDKTWHFIMMGRAPWNSAATISIPAHIVAVSLKLQNADLTTFTTVPVTAFETPTLNSPNFQASNYSTGASIQFADAVQRAEFFHKMLPGWHTALRPASIVQSLTITVPRFVTANVDGETMKVQTYFSSQASDGHTVVFLLDQFFNQQIFNIVNNEIKAGRFTTGALNVALFPNTYLFSLNFSGGVGDCCVLGFHTYFSETAVKESRWVFAFASWISPGIFSGFEDVTALSHEISEAMNDPFVNNVVPAWQYPNEPGTCQDNLETGDPVEVLSSPMFPVNVSGRTYHPQTEALLQWFEQKTTSTAINSAFSYPNTKALTKGAIAFGPLGCP